MWSFLSPARGISDCFTNTQDTTYTTKRVEEKKNKQARTWISSKRKKGEVSDTFSLLYASVAVTSVYSRILTQPPGTLTQPLTLANPVSGLTGPSSSLGGRLSLTTALLRLLLTSLYC